MLFEEYFMIIETEVGEFPQQREGSQEVEHGSS
jgi:hypothetical protein